MVVECLHRFCEECIERSMRVGRNQCPICRVVIPSRRSLAPDPDFDRLILMILGPEAVVSVDNTDGLSDSKANNGSGMLQKAIFRKHLELSGNPTVVSQAESEKTGLPVQEDCSSGEEEESDVVDVALFRHGDEVELDELLLPYLRLKETATIDVLKTFLKQKLAKPKVQLHIISYPHPDNPVILTDWIPLSVVASDLTDPSLDMIQLYYRKSSEKLNKKDFSLTVNKK
jgi:E3 ubiquitin-protein ligase RNF1/2